jgi:hypothetical protein
MRRVTARLPQVKVEDVGSDDLVILVVLLTRPSNRSLSSSTQHLRKITASGFTNKTAKLSCKGNEWQTLVLLNTAPLRDDCQRFHGQYSSP